MIQANESSPGAFCKTAVVHCFIIQKLKLYKKMKQVNVSITGMEAFIKFCEMAELNIQEKYVDNLQQDACICFLINGKKESSMEDAKEKYLIYEGKIVSIYGIFDNTNYGIKRLLQCKDGHIKNQNSEIKNIDELIKIIETPVK